MSRPKIVIERSSVPKYPNFPLIMLLGCVVLVAVFLIASTACGRVSWDTKQTEAATTPIPEAKFTMVAEIRWTNRNWVSDSYIVRDEQTGACYIYSGRGGYQTIADSRCR